jgi:putative two-component system response regulator
MRLDEGLSGLVILAVDDEDVNLILLRRLLERGGYSRVETTTDPLRVPELFAQTNPDLLILDLHMPGLDGFELIERLAPAAGGPSGVPILVLTADANEAVMRRALSSGARDFVTKPIGETELLLRVRNLLAVQHLHRQLRERNAGLELQVAERTRALEQARLEILGRLALAAEYRDDDTQEHAWRIGRTCALLARAIGLAEWQAELIRRAAPLHDIGKIGIPDAILLKPGRLTEDEFDTTKSHTTIGAEILSGSQSSLLLLAERIALSHHERWEGGGYPDQLCGEEIPLAARIAALADVFDALTHARPYKQAWPIEQAVAEVIGERGRQFDPALVDAFTTLDHQLLLSRVQHDEPRVNGTKRRSEARLAGLV